MYYILLRNVIILNKNSNKFVRTLFVITYTQPVKLRLEIFRDFLKSIDMNSTVKSSKKSLHSC